MARLFDDAGSEYLSIASAVLTTYPITMACWFYIDDATVQSVLMCIGVSGANDNYLFLAAEGGVAGDPLRARAASGGPASADTTTGFSVNTWHHGCAVFASATDRRVFIDGGSKGTNATSKTPTGMNRTFIGGRTGLTEPTGPTSGRIAEPGIWAAALTDAEVAELAEGVSPRTIQPAALGDRYWQLYGLASPEPPAIGGGVSLTLNGSPDPIDHVPYINALYPRRLNTIRRPGPRRLPNIFVKAA